MDDKKLIDSIISKIEELSAKNLKIEENINKVVMTCVWAEKMLFLHFPDISIYTPLEFERIVKNFIITISESNNVEIMQNPYSSDFTENDAKLCLEYVTSYADKVIKSLK